MLSTFVRGWRRFWAPPVAPPLDAAEVERLYPAYRWRALEATFIGYATFYLVRNNISTVTEELKAGLHYNDAQLGNIMAVTALTYGLSKFVMGAASDRSDARKFMAAGLTLTAL